MARAALVPFEPTPGVADVRAAPARGPPMLSDVSALSGESVALALLLLCARPVLRGAPSDDGVRWRSVKGDGDSALREAFCASSWSKLSLSEPSRPELGGETAA